jgi:methylmalonyl-CoA mutase
VASPDRNVPTFDDDLRIVESFPAPSLRAWEEAAQKSLKGRPPAALEVTTHEGLVVKPLYTAADLPLEATVVDPLRPGPPEVACPIDLRDPKGTIGMIAEALDNGVDALWIWVDRRSSSWGKLTAGAFALFQEAAAGIPIYLDGRGAALALAALLIASARRLEGGFEKLVGALDIDPIGALAADGALPTSLAGSLDQMAEALLWSEDHVPRLRTVGVSTLPHAKAGATAAQELAIALATGVAYLRAMEKRGISSDIVCRRLRFVTAVGRDLFMETAKLRALRLMWTRITALCGVSVDAAAAPIHAVTSPRCLTVRDPWVNILRGTANLYSAVIGGADVVTVLPFDSVIGRSEELARRLAVNTNHILLEESHIDFVRDPAAGSYFVERLTSDLVAAAWRDFQRIEAAGGMIRHLQSGALARELAETLAAKKRDVARLRDPITGVSSYPNLEEEALDRHRSRRDPRRSPDLVATDVHRAVGAESGSFAAALEAAYGGITAIDLIDVVRGSDEQERLAPVVTEREARPFEALRDLSDFHLRSTGVRPRVFVAVIGSHTENRGAVGAVTNLLAAGGIIAVLGEGLDGPDALASAYAASGSRAAVICASSENASELIPLLAREIKALRGRRVLVYGHPGRLETAWRKAGVDGFIHRDADAVALLSALLEAEGARSD